MRTFALIPVLALLLNLSVIAQDSTRETRLADPGGSTLITTPGLTLVYEVDFYGSEYDFIVHINEVRDGIRFDYEMTNDDNTKGSVSITADAFENATSLFNYFAGGPVELTDMTSVWMSKKTFNDLVGEARSATISVDGGQSTIEIKTVGTGTDFTIYNAISESHIRDVAYLDARTESTFFNAASFKIAFSRHLPLILEMNLGWTIKLKEMRRDG